MESLTPAEAWRLLCEYEDAHDGFDTLEYLYELQRRVVDLPSPRPVAEPPKARRGGKSTSRTAAEQNAPRRTAQRGRILLALFNGGEPIGGTAARIAERTALPLNSVSTRMSELERGGFVLVAGTAPVNGTPASVYELTGTGASWARHNAPPPEIVR